MRWRANPAVLLKDWGEELAVFCETTGNTHLLDPNGAAIFLALRAAPGALAPKELAAIVSAPEIPADALMPALEEQLDILRQYALVQQVDA
ncbi:MAG TPA: hypothetical protein PLW86_05990 [Rhodocyclaceae bacterium]|nr:hypothetical protein [Rhodocyclaceae bacterium]